ncbi:unnamed protein product [Acanthoscelides obtectus]|uniref:Uncharacterized protein n=1 Tax=Acanthoscelides obtectus TaxID=200917 RepID=A0A9P0LZ91_ACAOB|nr:unnamed protein product [Acanthoscelides obtectus]CAK1674669.1 hypothetical protein AOBTE_LOCUS29698 [Acanthoscelides obtectus]
MVQTGSTTFTLSLSIFNVFRNILFKTLFEVIVQAALTHHKQYRWGCKSDCVFDCEPSGIKMVFIDFGSR